MTALLSALSSPIYSLHLPHVAGHLTAVAWSPQGTHLAAVTSAGWVFVWESSTGELLHQHQIVRTPLLSVAWARQGMYLAVGCQKGLLRMLDEHLTVRAMYPFDAPVTHIAWAPHIVGACVIVTRQQVTILREESRTTRVLSYSSAVLDAAWSGDGRHFAILCADGLVEIWQARQGYLSHQVFTDPLGDGSVFWDQTCSTITIADGAGPVSSYSLLRSRPTPCSSVLLPKQECTRHSVHDPSGRYLATTNPHVVHLYAVPR